MDSALERCSRPPSQPSASKRARRTCPPHGVPARFLDVLSHVSAGRSCHVHALDDPPRDRVQVGLELRRLIGRGPEAPRAGFFQGAGAPMAAWPQCLPSGAALGARQACIFLVAN